MNIQEIIKNYLETDDLNPFKGKWSYCFSNAMPVITLWNIAEKPEPSMEALSSIWETIKLDYYKKIQLESIQENFKKCINNGGSGCPTPVVTGYNIEVSGTGSYIEGEKITGVTSGATGYVSGSTGNIVCIRKTKGTFQNGEIIRGEESNTTQTLICSNPAEYLKVDCRLNNTVCDFINIDGLIALLENTGTESTLFRGYDNQFYELSLSELRTIKIAMIQYSHSIYSKKWQYEQQILNAASIEEIESIVWAD